MFWPLLVGGLVLTALVGRITAQSGFDLGSSGKRPSLVNLIGFLFFPFWILLLVLLAATAHFFPGASGALMPYVPTFLFNFATGIAFAAAVTFPVSVPLLIGIPVGFLSGYWKGRWSIKH
ncbi:hypothetical protein [Mesorhizobium captivum]|uniref:hypothetical protein n=1 Tax=Mesorhizobium captivum TaxID=3072319 RepID=UPI002A24DDC4|nr:hypothetical protein [Mesorhizobium sp. VK3C]MDX8444479.1 hypothetical protein [Mesorhizobium sp. VK3C]